jgi:hypothetical protein
VLADPSGSAGTLLLRRETSLALDKAPLQVRELPLVFLPERLELPTASGTDVALTARKLRLLGQLRSGLGPWGAIVSTAAATTIAARAAMAPAATVNVIDSKVLQFRGVAFSSPPTELIRLHISVWVS